MTNTSKTMFSDIFSGLCSGHMLRRNLLYTIYVVIGRYLIYLRLVAVRQGRLGKRVTASGMISTCSAGLEPNGTPSVFPRTPALG